MNEGQRKRIQAFGSVCFCLFIVALVGGIGLIVFSKQVEAWLDWHNIATPVAGQTGKTPTTNAASRGPLWFAMLPQWGILLGASIGGWLWSKNWAQKQEAIAAQRDATSQSEEQFKRSHQKDRDQFQRRLLEERFNRILDDFASTDLIARAGAASRLASIAKELNPEADPGAPLTEDNNPFYMPAARQLVQGLIMHEDSRVGKAIQDALQDIGEWTKQQVLSARGNKDDKRSLLAEGMQIKVIHLLGDANRSALESFLDALARFLVSKTSIWPSLSKETPFGDYIFGKIDGTVWKSIGRRARWVYDEESHRECYRNFFESSFFINRFERCLAEVVSPHDQRADSAFSQAIQHLLVSRDALASALQDLLPTNTSEVPRVRLSQVFLGGVDLPNVRLEEVDFSFAHLVGVNFSAANFKNASFYQAYLEGTDLSESNLEDANFYMARLSRADISGANLKGADVSEANLCGADLAAANLEGADLFGANFEGVFLFDCEICFASFLPESVAAAEYRQREWCWDQRRFAIPDRELTEKERAHRDAVLAKLESQKRPLQADAAN